MHRYRQAVVDGGGNRRAVRLGHGCPGQGGNFAGDSQDRKRIGAVRCELDGEDAVIKIEHFAHVGARHGVGAQRQQSGVVVRESEFACGAQHAFAFDTAHLGTFDFEGLAVAIGGRR